MKKIITIIALAFFSMNVNAQTDTTKSKYNPKFLGAMEKQVAILDTATTIGTLQQCFNSIERISNAEKGEWLPNYYMAYCLVIEAYMADKNVIDDYCAKATKYLDKADSLHGDKSEIFVLRANVASAALMVNPQSRGGKYGKISSDMLDSAQVHNPNNPRIYLARAQGYYYTPKMFGGGKDKAKPVFEESIKKYDAFVPADSISPHWGRARAVMMLAECSKK